MKQFKVSAFLLAEPDGGFAGIVAVTNPVIGATEWWAWNGNWIALDGPAPRPGVEYLMRVLIDFKHTAPRVCYLLSEDGGDTYVALRHEGNAWIESASSEADKVTAMSFIGDIELADVTHRAIDGIDTARFARRGASPRFFRRFPKSCSRRRTGTNGMRFSLRSRTTG